MKKKKNYLDLVLYPNKSLSLTSMLFLSSIFVVLSFLISLYFYFTDSNSGNLDRPERD